MDGTAPKSQRRWFWPMPEGLLIGLLAVEGFLFLAERFRWFAFNQHKGWTVLIAVAAVVAVLLTMCLWFAASLCSRCRFQFSVRSLLVLVVAVAVPCSWLAVEMKKAREQQAVVDAIAKAGGALDYDYEVGEFGSPTFFGPPPVPPAPAWMRQLLGDSFFADVAWIWVDSDAGMESLRAFPQLRGMQIEADKVSADGMQHLRAVPRLRTLAIRGLTDAWLAQLDCLPQLEFLTAWGGEVSGRGLVHLKKGNRLRRLALDHTNVTDADLIHLEGLKHLRYLWLDGSKVTAEGVERLQRALPDCQIGQ